MKYDNSPIRRQDRLLDEAAARILLKNGEYGVLSLIDSDGHPYGIPISYVWDGKESIYLHCAPTGKKLYCIQHHDIVCFCVIGHTNVVPNKFTTGYESIVLQCKAVLNLPADEKMQALKYLLEKYSPEDQVIGMKYAEKSFHRTEIIRLDITTWSGKCKNVR